MNIEASFLPFMKELISELTSYTVVSFEGAALFSKHGIEIDLLLSRFKCFCGSPSFSLPSSSRRSRKRFERDMEIFERSLDKRSGSLHQWTTKQT